MEKLIILLISQLMLYCTRINLVLSRMLKNINFMVHGVLFVAQKKDDITVCNGVLALAHVPMKF